MIGAWMEEEILAQPELLAENAGRYKSELAAALKGRDFEMVLLVARGSSDHAALYARYLIEIHLGIPVVLAAPSVLTVYGQHVRYPKCLAVGISQSGAAPDVAEVLKALREAGHTTLGITNEAHSHVGEVAEFNLLLGVEKERSVAATKTFTASVLALYQLVAAINPTMPLPVLPTVSWLRECLEEAEKQSGVLVRSAPLFSIGRGYEFSTASESAIKLMECALLSCKAYSSADFQHGPKALAGAGSAIIDFTGSLASTLGQPAEFVAPPSLPSDVPAEMGPLWQVPFGQWLALLAARARGLDPDQPRFIQKVTQTT
jgi:glutamine---fructose-6-phosphate transaminase (isomerizing)